MSIKKRFKVKQQQKVKRRKRRAKLRKQGKNLGDVFYGKHFVGRK